VVELEQVDGLRLDPLRVSLSEGELDASSQREADREPGQCERDQAEHDYDESAPQSFSHTQGSHDIAEASSSFDWRRATTILGRVTLQNATLAPAASAAHVT
jgi:hypothetical protein